MAGVTVTAVAAGAAGNLISLNIIDTSVPNTVLSITVVGNAISITVADDAGGARTSTNLLVVNLINGTPAAAALVTASTTDPASIVAANGGIQFLSGGGGATTGGYCGQDLGNYKILLLDQNRVQVSNVPLLFSNFFHVPDNAVNQSAQSSAASIPKNFWPTPPMAYRVNSAIRFYIYMTSATPLASDVNFDIVFSGIRRYPCK